MWDSILGYLGQDAAGKTDSLPNAVILALLSAIVAILSFTGQYILTAFSGWREERRKFRSDLIHFYTGMKIWQSDFGVYYGNIDAVKRYKKDLLEGPPDFKFKFSGETEASPVAILEHIHRLSAEEVALVRAYIDYGTLFVLQLQAMSTDEFAIFERDRKVRALINTYESGHITWHCATRAIERLRYSEFLGFRISRSYLSDKLLSAGDPMAEIVKAKSRVEELFNA
jgi:hypothetical protein